MESGHKHHGVKINKPGALVGLVFAVAAVALIWGALAFFGVEEAENERGPVILKEESIIPREIILEPPPPVPPPKRVVTAVKHPIGLVLWRDLLWKSGTIDGYAEVPKESLASWEGEDASRGSTVSKNVKGTYYYAVRKHSPAKLADSLLAEQQKIEEYFAKEMEKLGFTRRGPAKTLTTIHDDYIRTDAGMARAASVHIGAEFNTNCPQEQKTVIGELCSPLKVVNELYSVFVSEPFPISWK